MGMAKIVIEGLKIVYVDNKIESDSRAQQFFVSLQNEIVQERETPDGPPVFHLAFQAGAANAASGADRKMGKANRAAC